MPDMIFPSCPMPLPSFSSLQNVKAESKIGPKNVPTVGEITEALMPIARMAMENGMSFHGLKRVVELVMTEIFLEFPDWVSEKFKGE